MRDPNDPGSWEWIGDILHTILKDIGEELGYAVDDIRHKVVEEGTFGRQLTGDAFSPAPDREAVEHNSAAAQRDFVYGKGLSIEDEMAARSRMPEREREPEHEQEGHDR